MKCFLAGQHEPLQPWSYGALTMNVGQFLEPARPVEMGLVILTSPSLSGSGETVWCQRFTAEGVIGDPGVCVNGGASRCGWW